MRFYTLEEKKPKYGEKVLAKIRSKEGFCHYYVVCRTTKSIFSLVEGTKKWEQEIYMEEEYAWWKEEEIIGWTSFNEIEKNEEWQENK